jgi:CHAD domain-containing protein
MFKEKSAERIPFKEYIIEYADKQIETAFMNMESVKDDFDEEAVHDFRVSVKRMRVLMWFLSLFDERIASDESIANERSFFKLLSPIRDRQVQIQRLNDTAHELSISIPALQKYMVKRLQKAKRRFQMYKHDFMPQMHFEMVKVPLSHILSDEMLLREAESQAGLLLEKARLEMPHFISDDEVMHESRKDFKKVVYLMEMLKVTELKVNSKKFPIKELKSLQEALGEAHDYVVGRKMVRKFMFKKNKSGQKYHRLAEWIDRKRILEIDRFKEQFNLMVLPEHRVNLEFLQE